MAFATLDFDELSKMGECHLNGSSPGAKYPSYASAWSCHSQEKHIIAYITLAENARNAGIKKTMAFATSHNLVFLLAYRVPNN